MFSPRTPAKSKSASLSLPHSRSSLNRSRNVTPRRGLRNQSALASQSFHGPQLIEETPQHRIETVGLPLPVLITEALTSSDRSTTEITACIDPSGWAWLVGGRKLFVWRYKDAGKSRSGGACKELTLPPSDLAHSAERVCLIPSRSEGQPAACVAVSPEGVVRYWPNIAFEASTAEISAELQGEECARVINFQPYGCLLATTTSSLLLLEPVVGQASIQCKALKSSQGIFSGISRRMSSFIFGASVIETNGAPLQAIVAAPEDEYDDDEEGEDRRSFYVLSGNHLNKWQVPTIGTEKLVYQMDAERVFRETLAKDVWQQDSVQLPQLNTWLLDLQLISDGIILLGAGVNSEVDNTLYYAVVYMETKNDAVPTAQDFVKLDHTQKYSEETEDQLLSYRLLLPTPKSNIVFIYSNSSILMLQDKSTLDKMDLRTSGDCLLGAGGADGLAVFFSNTHGIFSVSTPKPDSILDESNNQSISISRAELSTMALHMSRTVDLTESSDSKVVLKNAFIASIGGETEKAQSLVEELYNLSEGPTSSEAHGSKLDSIVAAVSRDLVDDFPNADPRWAESGLQNSSSSTVSVIIVQQLKDKQVAHDLFVTFLKNFGLWNQLGCVSSIHGNIMPTSLLLCENMEKLEAAIGLRELHTEYYKLIDFCITSVIKARQQPLPDTLLPQDLFYQEVSKVSEIMPVLVTREKELLAADQPSHAVVSLILAVDTILEAMLHLALQYRQVNTDKYAEDNRFIPEYIPWSATPDIRETITQQINISLQRGIPEAREIDVQGLIYQKIVGLADILMDGYASQLHSLDSKVETSTESSIHREKLEKEFEKRRHSLIISLLDNKQYDRAASLAEKYEDFEMLMRICDATDNQDRLQRYRIQYADKGFSKFLFNWYMKEGKRSHLLAQPVMQGDELSNFLDADNVKYLSWLHEIRQGNYTAAQRALADLATNERNFLSKKKTLLSLSKLAALASEDTDENLEDNIEVINEELDLVTHQELLPAHTIESVGMDPDNMRVLTPEELIELYVSEKNTDANELDVKKALDLLRYVDRDDDIDFAALKLHIWSRAILMDSWTDDPKDTDSLNSNKDKIFFRTVNLVNIDGDLDLYLPEFSALMASPELAELSKQPHFQYLMQGGYEQIRANLAQAD
ncbi:hypothetical protein RRG08_042655 [Elysia crispata]|uniref:Nuclear pore complex protein Nup133 n=1 Tax=Elysia crispata TaxID=231223 RepID=A0AAE1CKD8_9GAST|nr:hypothetical protein RRG08_042655 [Elysia crispata]